MVKGIKNVSERVPCTLIRILKMTLARLSLVGDHRGLEILCRKPSETSSIRTTVSIFSSRIGFAHQISNSS
jgi:hypothetical protein